MTTASRVFRPFLAPFLAPLFLLTSAVPQSIRPAQPSSATIHSVQEEKELEVAIPEVYELVNIAIALTPFGETHPYYIDSESPYYAEIQERFGPYKSHPFIAAIQEFHGDVDEFNFLKMRAVASRFVGEEIECDKDQLYLPSDEDEAQLDEELTLAAQFARDTEFRSFYEEHLPLYRQRLELFRAVLPVRDAWNWLEEQFPARNLRVRIFLSPLTGWSHFARGQEDQTDIFIFGPPEAVGSEIEAAWFSMVLFTELDHKYVDVFSREHSAEIDATFSAVESWNGQGGYRTPQLTFSEYMTWAVFCLFASDRHSPADFLEIKRNTEEFMTVGRRFPRFGEFNDEVLSLYRKRGEGETVSDLYEEILAWARDAGSSKTGALGG